MTPSEAYYKALDTGKRLPELEDVVLTDPFCSYAYAQDIIKDRWIEAEDIIATHSGCTYRYAAHIIRGKLPEKMHNMMILHAIKDTNDRWVKQYFNAIKDPNNIDVKEYFEFIK